MKNTFPVYSEFGGAFHKVEDDKHFIEIYPEGDRWEEGIVRRKQPETVKLIVSKGREISEACFNNHFQRALSKLNEMASDQLGIEDWTDQQIIEAQDRREELADLLVPANFDGYENGKPI